MKIFKNFIYTSFSQILLIILPFITVPYLSRILGVEGVGLSSYIISVLAYFSQFASLGISIYGNRTIAYYKDNRDKMSSKFIEIMKLKIFLFLGTYIIFLLCLPFFGKFKYLFLIQSITLIANLFDISWLYFGLEEFKKNVLRNIFVKIFSLILIFLFVKNYEDIGIYLFILSTSAVIGNILLWINIHKFIVWKKTELNTINYHFKETIKLFLPQIVMTLFATVSSIMLSNLANFEQNGLFSNSDKIVRIQLALVIAVGTVFFPKISNLFKNDRLEEAKEYVYTAFDIVNILSFPMVVGLFIIKDTFSVLFFGSHFKGISLVMSVLSIELIFMGWSSIVGQQFMVAINRVKGITVSMIVALIITVIGNLILIRKYGALGSSIVQTISEFIIFGIQFYYIRHILSLKKLFMDIWKPILSSIIMFIFCFLFSKVTNFSSLITMLLQVILGVFIYLIVLFILKPRILKKVNF